MNQVTLERHIDRKSINRLSPGSRLSYIRPGPVNTLTTGGFHTVAGS